MIRKIFAFLLLFSSFNFCLYAEINYPLITEMFLLESKTESGYNPPAKLSIGIDIVKNAYYKLSYNNDIIRAGLLRKGINLINIETKHLFEKSGSYIYLLNLKVNSLILEEKIEIDIQLDTDTQSHVEEEDDKFQNMEYELSMFIGEELVVFDKKKHFEKFPLKIDLPPVSKYYKPYDPNERHDPFSNVNLFSIPAAVAAIYDLIKGLKKERRVERWEDIIQRKKQITATFIRKDSGGREREVKAVITLRTGNI